MLPHPPPGPRRRRLALLAAAALAALVAGVVAGAGGGGGRSRPASPAAAAPPKRALARARRMPLSRQIGELLVISFPAPGVPSYAKRALRQGRAGGVVLFRGNATTPAAMQSVTSAVQRAGRHQVLICVDQEGGPLRILPWAAPALAQSAQSTPAVAEAQARAAARGLAAAGVNVALAPVADVAESRSVVSARAFPGGTSQA